MYMLMKQRFHFYQQLKSALFQDFHLLNTSQDRCYGKIVKIGGTYVGMKGRHGSYNCGTRKARNKGTCSVTNFNITETQYTAIREGKKVEWYVFDVPLAEATINLPWGDEIKYNAKTFYKYESSLCSKYQQLTGHFPPLSDNAGVE